MDTNGDGIDDALQTTERTLLTVAMQMGEKLARLREDLAKQKAGRDDAVSREMASRFQADRATAVAEVNVVHNSQWWDSATIEDVARVAETAETWKKYDGQANLAADTIAVQVKDRYGIDVDQLRSDAQQERAGARTDEVQAALLLQEADRHDREADRGTARDGEAPADRARDLEEQALKYDAAADSGGDGTNTPESLRVLADDARQQAQLYRDMADAERSGGQVDAASAADRADSARGDAAIAYDSAERRRDTARRMEGKGVPADDIKVRMRADADQGRPPSEAVIGEHAAARPTQSTNTRVVQRNDRSR